MRVALAARPMSVEFTMPRVAGLVLGGVALVVAANLTHDRLFHAGVHEAPTAATGAKIGEVADHAEPAKGDAATTVTLPPGKFDQAGIQVGAVETLRLPSEVTVAGRIEADPYHRVDVRPKAAGVVRSINVRPGQTVKAGEILVVLNSPDIGTARLGVRARQRELATARVEAAWKAEVAANVNTLITQLMKGAPASGIAREFADRPLGASRGTLLAAYTEMEIASHEAEKMADLNKKKVVGEHPVFLAQHTYEGAHAKFEAALEQVKFDISQQDRIARQTVRTAEEAVVDAAQRLKILGVEEDVADLLAHPERASALPSGSEDLTAYPIAAPFDGTVVSTSTVMSQRVELTDPLCVLADLRTVWAVANVPESYYPLLPKLAGGRVRLDAEAYPGRTFEASVLYVGSEVDPTTRTVRLVAQADNAEGLFKLGMFSNIVLDSTSDEPALVVPSAAVIEIDGKPGVFLPAKAVRTYTLRPVTLGRTFEGKQVLASGVKAGEPVVTAGAFTIKSELILQNETDEE